MISSASLLYLPVENAILTLDFVDKKSNLTKSWMADDLLEAAFAGLQEIGITNLHLHCDDLLMVRHILDLFRDRHSTKIAVFLPYQLAESNITELHQILQRRRSKVVLQLPNLDDFHVDRLRLLYIDIVRKLDLPLSALEIEVNKPNVNHIVDLLTNLYSETGLSFVMVPRIAIFDDDSRAALSWQELDKFYQKVIDLRRTVGHPSTFLFELGILPTRLLTEHPCNGYVCSGQTCHSAKNNLPRRLVLLADGTVVPFSPRAAPAVSLGNIQNASVAELLRTYAQSKRHQEVLNISKEIFIDWIQPCPYRVIPWDHIFVNISRNQTIIDTK